MEVEYTKKKSFYFFNHPHDKFLIPSLLTSLKKILEPPRS